MTRWVAGLLLPTHRIAPDDLLARGTARARELRDQGLLPGDIVICRVASAGCELDIMQDALALSGAALLPVSDELDLSAVRALASQTAAAWYWQAPAERGGCLMATGIATGSSSVPPGHQPALVVQTSGSSGGRKAALLSGAAVQASCARINARLGLQAGDLWLCALPRQHIGGLMIGYRCALAGAEVLRHPRFDAEQIATDLWQHPLTHLSLVPAMLARLLAQCPRPPDWLRVVLIGGQALDPHLAERACAAGWPLHLGYGMTETCSFIASRALDGSTDPDLVPLPDVHLACDPASGVLRVKAPMLMSGYANPERHAGLGLDPDGWLTTADLACLTTAGRLRVRGRADERLVIAGVNVDPHDVERQLGTCPGLGECALVGLPDPVWGHTLVALYLGPVEAAVADQWCRANLPSPSRPRLFLRLSDWPLLASGKRDRARLRAIAAAAWHCS